MLLMVARTRPICASTSASLAKPAPMRISIRRPTLTRQKFSTTGRAYYALRRKAIESRHGVVLEPAHEVPKKLARMRAVHEQWSEVHGPHQASVAVDPMALGESGVRRATPERTTVDTLRRELGREAAE